MSWSANDYPPAMKHLSPEVRRKAIEIANAILKDTGDEGHAISVGIAKAKEHHGKKGSAQAENMALIGSLAPEEKEETQQTVSAPTGGPHAFAATAAEEPTVPAPSPDPEDPTLHILGYGVLRRSQIEKGAIDRLEDIITRAKNGDWGNALALFKNGVAVAMLEALDQHRWTGVWYDPEEGRAKKLTKAPRDL